MSDAVRPLRMVQHSYSIHRLYDDGRMPVWTAPGETLEDCIAAVLPLASRGDKFAVVERDHLHGDVVVRLFVVKQRAATHTVYVGHHARKVAPIYAEPLMTMRFPGGEWPL